MKYILQINTNISLKNGINIIYWMHSADSTVERAFTAIGIFF